MALATTTLSSACAASDTSIVVASATSVAAGRLVLIDDEFMQVTKGYSSGTTVPVTRGLQGTVLRAHPATANVTHGEPSDFPDAPVQNAPVTLPYIRTTRVVSYSSAGAITLPRAGEDLRVILNGTTGSAMTLAAPTRDLDGCILTIVANGNTSSNTVTITAGVGGAGGSYDVITFNANGQAAVQLIACNADWCALGPWGGTLTNIVATVA